VSKRLICFLGTTTYCQTSYVSQDPQGNVVTPFVPRALAEIHEVDRVDVLATEAAWDKNGALLTAALAGLPSGAVVPNPLPIPKGETSGELWEQFDVLRGALTAREDEELLLDVTYGFRAQPFFAAAAISFLRALGSAPGALRVFYGAYERGVPDSPLWELTPFVELVDWTHALTLFLRTGRSEGVAERTRTLGRELAKAWALADGDKGPRPKLAKLGGLIDEFGDDLQTLRTGALLLGSDTRKGSAERLQDAAAAARAEVEQFVPPLAAVFAQVEALTAHLGVDDLQSPAGERALATLARRYADMGRYSEALATIREAWVTRMASPEAACPGSKSFDASARTDAERQWTAENKGRDAVIALRNDIQHAGYRSGAVAPQRLRKRLEEQLDRLSDTAASCSDPAAPGVTTPPSAPRTLANVSNHPHSGWPAEQVVAAEALASAIHDVPFPLIPSGADLPAVYREVRDCLDSVPTEASHALVAGEYVATTLIVQGLQRRGVTCLVATTEREVVDHGDGTHTRNFRFVRFREYPSLIEGESG
jgi:CRISPR-associated protein Csx16